MPDVSGAGIARRASLQRLLLARARSSSVYTIQSEIRPNGQIDDLHTCYVQEFSSGLQFLSKGHKFAAIHIYNSSYP